MPTVYLIKCEACGFLPSYPNHQQDDRPGDLDVCCSDSALMYRGDDGELVGLPHPGEQRALEGLGGDWDSALEQGRLIAKTYKFCTACGVVNDDARVLQEEGFCGAVLIALLASVSVFIARPIPSGRWHGPVGLRRCLDIRCFYFQLRPVA